MTLPTEKLYTWQRGTDVPFRTRASMGKVVPAGTDIQTRAICSKSQPNAVTSSLQGLLVKTEI